MLGLDFKTVVVKRKLKGNKKKKYCFSLLLEFRFMLEPLFIFPNYVNVIKYCPTKYYQPSWNTTSDSSNSTGKTTLQRTCKSWSLLVAEPRSNPADTVSEPGSAPDFCLPTLDPQGSRDVGATAMVRHGRRLCSSSLAKTSLQFSWINTCRPVLSLSA